MKKGESISILISYDQCMIAEGLEAILSKQKNIQVAYLIKNNINLNVLVGHITANILIVELAEISRKNVNYIISLHKSLPKLKLLVISGLPTREFLEQLINVVNGYLIRTCTADKLVLAVREITETGKYICSQIIPILFDNNHNNHLNVELTSREKEILSLLYTNNSKAEIAESLNISQTTFRTHLKNIRHKFGNLNQVEMMRYACCKNLLGENFIPLCPNCKFFCNREKN